jgi:cytochrome c-type biogenesis protein CcmF
MTILIGNVALTMALLAAAVGLLAGMMGARFGAAVTTPHRVGRWAVWAQLAGLTLAVLALLGALVDSDFRLGYVARYTERALPIGYKLAAFWAGQEGSLLLWAWLIAAMGVIYVFVTRKVHDTQNAASMIVVHVVLGFFAALMLFAANPFVLSEGVPVDGRGLNPMLQDWGMIAHPPLLFLGYAGFTFPFAMMVGALVSRRADNGWVAGTRRWVIASWLFLTVGIVLGARWAYVELGWGGYWAWDPVENASLLPWLTGTALLHSIMVQQQRGMLKRWNAVLIAVSFVLCVFGTYLTRSGVVDSVHTFGKSLVGTFFLVFLVGLTLGSLVLIAARWRALRPEHALESACGRETAFVVTNVLLLVMTAVVTVGTIFPVISSAFTGKSISVQQPFYNKVVVPMGVALMALMAIGPLLGLGKGAAGHLRARVTRPLIGGTVTALVLGVFWGVTNPWGLAAAFITGTAVVAIVADLLSAVGQRILNHRENPAVALVRTIDGNHRRYGGQAAHVGMLMMMVGIAGSSLYNQKQDVQLSPGTTQKAGAWTVELRKIEEVRAVNYTAVQVTAAVTDPSGRSITLTPQRRFYDKFDQSNSEVAIQSTLGRDAYLSLAGWDDGGRVVALQLLVNPLVRWLWIGGWVMASGAVLCLLPRLIPAGGCFGETPVAAETVAAERQVKKSARGRELEAVGS